jgi:O-antigen/teichoic acid export membrane protein
VTKLKRNIVANLVGSGWTALAGLVFTPLYIRFLGIEAYGLVGFCLMLQTTLLVMDLGLSTTLNRVLARSSAAPEGMSGSRDFVRTTEAISWGTGICVGAALLLLAPSVARHWIGSTAIPSGEILRTLRIICVNLALQFPLGFYMGGLMGLQKQVQVNIVRVLAATAGGAGAAFVLWKVSPTAAAFFSWQVLVTAVQAASAAILLWTGLPGRAGKPRFEFGLFRKEWRFAAGMTCISISGLVLTQMDKVVLSRILSLSSFGHYTLAGVVSTGLYMFIIPVFNAVFPRFSALVAARDEKELRLLYHRGAQFTAVLLLPVASVLALFPREILLLWTNDREIALAAAPLVSALTLGTALNGLMHIPYALQLAYGWTRIAVAINLLLVAVLLPAAVFLAGAFGAPGGASAWALLNILYMAVGIPLTHRRVLPGESVRWFREDFLLPAAGALGIALAGRALPTSSLSPLSTLAFLSFLLAGSAAAAAAAAPCTRAWLRESGILPGTPR